MQLRNARAIVWLTNTPIGRATAAIAVLLLAAGVFGGLNQLSHLTGDRGVSSAPHGGWLWHPNKDQALYLDLNGGSGGQVSYVHYDDQAHVLSHPLDLQVTIPQGGMMQFGLQGFDLCSQGCAYTVTGGQLLLQGDQTIALAPAPRGDFDQIVDDLSTAESAASAKQQTFVDGRTKAETVCTGNHGTLQEQDATWVCYFPEEQPLWVALFDEQTGNPMPYSCADYSWVTSHGMPPEATSPTTFNEGCTGNLNSQHLDLDVTTAQQDCVSGAYFNGGKSIPHPSDNTAKRYLLPYVWHADLAICTAVQVVNF